MLEQESLDGVVIAAPDHHHAQAMMLACAAGVDVYVEKPMSLTVQEGRWMVQAAARHRRVVQVGSQQRTMEFNRFGCEFVRAGKLGKIHRVRMRNLPGPLFWDRVREQPSPRFPVDWSAQTVPPDLDWNLFCGPAPVLPYHSHLWVKDAYRVHGLAVARLGSLARFLRSFDYQLGGALRGHGAVRFGARSHRTG